jgi:capsular polysaccharide biosynthesis protein
VRGDRPPTADFRYLVSTNAAGWFGGLVEAALGLTPDLIETYDPKVERVRLRHAVVPTLCVTPNHLHPASALLFDRLGACGRGIGRGLPKRVFVSRRAFSNGASTPRLCRNEDEIIQIAEDLGLTSINPETLPFSQQVALFQRLEVGVGVFGSGLHNAVFCRAGATIGTIGYLNYIQSGIAGLRGLRQAYLTPADPVDSPDGFEVDPALFRDWLTAVLAQSPAPRARRWSLPRLARRACAS